MTETVLQQPAQLEFLYISTSNILEQVGLAIGVYFILGQGNYLTSEIRVRGRGHWIRTIK